MAGYAWKLLAERLADPNDCDDVRQDVMLAILIKVVSGQRIEQWRPLVHETVRRAALAFMRSRGRRTCEALPEGEHACLARAGYALEQAELNERVEKLPPRRKRLMDLCSQPLSNSEIAAALGCTEGTFWWLRSACMREIVGPD